MVGIKLLIHESTHFERKRERARWFALLSMLGFTMTFMLAMLLSREIDHAGDYDNDLAEMYARSACMQGVGDRLKVILLCPELHDTDKVILLCTGFSCI